MKVWKISMSCNNCGSKKQGTVVMQNKPKAEPIKCFHCLSEDVKQQFEEEPVLCP